MHDPSSHAATHRHTATHGHMRPCMTHRDTHEHTAKEIHNHADTDNHARHTLHKIHITTQGDMQPQTCTAMQTHNHTDTCSHADTHTQPHSPAKHSHVSSHTNNHTQPHTHTPQSQGWQVQPFEGNGRRRPVVGTVCMGGSHLEISLPKDLPSPAQQEGSTHVQVEVREALGL